MLLELLLACKPEPLECADQPAFHGDVDLKKDDQVQAFMEDYRAVEGNLLIRKIDSALELAGLCRVSGNLMILDSLPTYLGMERLEEVDGLILSNAASLQGFSGLRRARFIRVNSDEGLPGLVELAGLTELDELDLQGEVLSISGLERLTRLNGLVILSLELVDLRPIEQLEQMRSLALWLGPETEVVLPRLRTVEDLQLAGVSAMDFSGLETAGSLKFSRTRMQNLELPNLVTVSYDLTIDQNEQLSHLDGLYGLRSVEKLKVRGNPLLPQAEIDALIEHIGLENIGSIEVSDNAP